MSDTDVRLVPANDEEGSWDLEANGCILSLSRRDDGEWTFWQADIEVGIGETIELGDKVTVRGPAAQWLEDAWRAAGGPSRDGA